MGLRGARGSDRLSGAVRLRGRVWLIVGVLAGIAIAIGHLDYLAGAGRTLADTAERLVGSGASWLTDRLAATGASGRVVLGLTGAVAVLIPGLTAFLLIVAARGTLRLRAVIGLLVLALAAATYLYHPGGQATGVLLLVLVIASVAVAFTGPLVAAPLAALAGLIAGEFLPGLVQSSRVVTQRSVSDLHQAIFGHPGTPTLLQLAVLLLALIPFAGRGPAGVLALVGLIAAGPPESQRASRNLSGQPGSHRPGWTTSARRWRRRSPAEPWPFRRLPC